MTVVDAMLGNAAVAAVLALIAVAVGWACRSPAMRHVAWVLVLLKLVTPPLVRVPLPVLPASWVQPPTESAPPAGRVLPTPMLAPSTPNSSDSPAEGVVRAPAWGDRWRPVEAADWALVVWGAGAVGWFAWQGRRIVRFRRRVARAPAAGPEVAAAARRIAAALGIAHPPAVKAATGIASPMLWGWGRGTVVLFPRELLARLAPEACDTLLAHELAHFLRRDHWVRVLEFVATGLFWWHPAVWLARAGIEAAEEECCDAWVVGGLSASPRRYAEALLATVDYAAELRRPCLPPGACPANRSARLLRRRLLGIIHVQRPSRLRGSATVRAVALTALLIQPVLQAARESGVGSREPGVRGQESGVGRQESGGRNHKGLSSDSCPPTPDSWKKKSAEPPAWAIVSAPGGAVAAVAREHEVVLRRPDGTATVLGPGKPLALAFAPNEPRLATAGPGTLVRTWDYRGNVLSEARTPAAARALAYTPDGVWLLVLDAAGGISVHDPRTLDPVAGWSVDGPANSLACAPDGRTVAVAFGSWRDAETGWVECWSIPERRKLVRYPASAPVGAIRFVPDGRMLIAGGWNGLVDWRALPGGELVTQRQVPKALVAATAFSPDARTLPLEPPPEPAPPPTLVPELELLRGVGQLPRR